MDRFTRLLAGADGATRILEIGPSHAPVAARRDGWNTRIVDHADADELRAKYAGIGVDPSRIEEVDIVWRGGPLDAAIPEPWRGQFDLLIASHVIEHIPDFAGFLKSLETVLAPDGSVSFAVPDKRYCFDVFKPLATTGDVLAAAGTSRHSKRSAWNHPAYSVTYDGTIAWGQHKVDEARFIHDFGDAAKAIAAWREDGPYQDYHAWQFTPASFALIILELGAAGLIDWHIAEATEALGCEFFVLLRRGAEQPDPASLAARRMALLQQTQRELADGLVFQGLAAPPDPFAGVKTRLDAMAAQQEAIATRQEAIDAQHAARLDAMAARQQAIDAQHAARQDAIEASLAALQDAMALQNARLLLLVQTPAWARGLAALARRVLDLARRLRR